MNLKDLSDIGGQFSEKMNFFLEKLYLISCLLGMHFCVHRISI